VDGAFIVKVKLEPLPEGTEPVPVYPEHRHLVPPDSSVGELTLAVIFVPALYQYVPIGGFGVSCDDGLAEIVN